jgi:hypothetical protein
MKKQIDIKRARKLIDKFVLEKIPDDPLSVDTNIKSRKYQIFNQYYLLPGGVKWTKQLINKAVEMKTLMRHNLAASVLFNKEYEQLYDNGKYIYCFPGIEEQIGRKLKLSEIKKLDIIYYAPRWFNLYEFIHIQYMPDGSEVRTPAIGLTTICRYVLMNKNSFL